MPPGFCHNIVWSPDTFEELLRRIDGQEPEPLDPDTHRCETIDGVQLEPTEAITNALVNNVRRVVVDAAEVTLDMGRKRLFTGALRDALSSSDGCESSREETRCLATRGTRATPRSRPATSN